jgi:GNAT superfamily N-acetyltransferase
MSQKRNVNLREYASSDAEGIVSLMNTVFKPEFTTDWWKWKYEHNPSGFWGKEGDTWVAEDNNKIVGHYAVIPYKIKYYSKTIVVAQSVDTATHPSYRGMGIFTRLAKKVYASASKRYPFVFGFPSEMAHDGFIKLGWRDLSLAPSFDKIQNYDAVVERTIGSSAYRRFGKPILKAYVNLARVSTVFSPKKTQGEDIEVEAITRFDGDINTFWEYARRDFCVVLERNEAFLNWRFSKYFGEYKIFLARAAKHGDIVGYAVLRKRADSLDIIDFVTILEHSRTAQQLIQAVLVEGKIEGADSIKCWFPKWHKNAFLFKKAGFVSFDPILHLQKKYVQPIALYDFGQGKPLPNMKEWFYTCADTDFQ